MNFEAKEFWVDGGCRGNGTDHAAAYGSISDGVDFIRLNFPYLKTNNEAEYLTLIFLLLKLDPTTPCVIHTDSALLLGQLTKGWKIKAANLKNYYAQATELLKERPNILLEWVPRAEIVKVLGH